MGWLSVSIFLPSLEQNEKSEFIGSLNPCKPSASASEHSQELYQRKHPCFKGRNLLLNTHTLANNAKEAITLLMPLVNFSQHRFIFIIIPNWGIYRKSATLSGHPFSWTMLLDSAHMRGTGTAPTDHLSLTHGGTHNQNPPLLLVADNWLNALEIKELVNNHFKLNHSLTI